MRVVVFIILSLLGLSILSAQTPPTASDVSILGEAYFFENGAQDESTTLTGSYTYNGDNDEGATEFTWYRNGTPIAGATSIRYTLVQNDNLQDITFGVKPYDNLGNNDATYTSSAVTVQDASTPDPDIRDVQMDNDTDNSGGTEEYLNLHIKGNKYYTVTNGTTVKIYGDLAKPSGEVNKVTLNITGNSTVIVYGQFIATDDMEINVESGSTFTVVSGLDARDGANLDIDGDMTVNGDVTVEDDAVFNIADGGSLDVDGDVELGDNGNLTLDGDMSIGGDFDTGTNGTITVNGTGSLVVDGDLDGDADIEGTGPVTVGGEVGGDINDTLGNQITQLPVELVSFIAQKINSTIVLKWTTATEENNDYFTIERSQDAINFTEIDYKAGAGNSTHLIDYTYTDNNPLDGISYYRIKQTDFDGQFSFSAITSVYNNNVGNFEIGPNPANNYVHISSEETLTGSIKIISYNGAVVKEVAINGNFKTIDVSDINAGSYIAVYTTESGVKHKKIILK